MKRDKSLLPFCSFDTLVQYQIYKLSPFFKTIYLSLKNDKFDFLNEKQKLILDKSDIYSPILALKAILETIKENKTFIIAVDTPLLKKESIEKLIKNSNNYDITIAQTKKIHNLCGVYNKSCLPFINKMIKDNIHKVNYLIRSAKTNIINFANDDEFININNKEEYEKAKLLLHEKG